jgi:hypothetical protein
MGARAQDFAPRSAPVRHAALPQRPTQTVSLR